MTAVDIGIRRIWKTALWEKMIVSVAVGLSAYCLATGLREPITDTAQYFTLSSLHAEIASGLLPLRIASLTLAVKVVLLAAHLIFVERLGGANRRTEAKGRIPEVYSCDVRDSANLAQYAIFLLALTMLWSSARQGRVSAPIALLNFVLFFFVDDFGLISDYFNKFGGRMLLMHSIRLHVANSALAVGTIAVAFTTMVPNLAFVYSTLVAAAVAWRYVTLWLMTNSVEGAA